MDWPTVACAVATILIFLCLGIVITDDLLWMRDVDRYADNQAQAERQVRGHGVSHDEGHTP